MEARRVTITGFYQELREQYREIFFKIQKKYGLDEEVDVDDHDHEEEYAMYEEEIITKLENLKSNNIQQYLLVISMLYHDYILSVENKKDPLYSVLQEQFESVKEQVGSLKDLYQYLEENREFHSDLVEEFMEFSEMDFFERRERFLETKELDRYLTTIFPPHLIDKFYHVITYTEEDLMSYFVEEDMAAVGVIISLLQNLSKVDTNNFDKLIEPLIYKYYKNFSYKKSLGESDKDNDELLELIEKEDIGTIKDRIVNCIDYLEYIILEFYNDSFIYNEEYKEEVNKNYNKHKVKKLEEMM